jgi:hypothetical protein
LCVRRRVNQRDREQPDSAAVAGAAEDVRLDTMKKAMKTLMIGLLSVGTVAAQEFVAPEAERPEVVPAEPAERGPSIEGIVKEIFTKRPWQLVNPAAPPEYGSGQRMVSQDFGPGTPYHSTGLIVASIEW